MPFIRRLVAVAGLLLVPLAVGADCMGPYPPSMVRSFNQSCAKDPKLEPFCTCIMDEVQKTIPLADFIEIGNLPGGINNDPRFIKASKKCSTLLSASPGSATPATQQNAPKAMPTGQLR